MKAILERWSPETPLERKELLLELDRILTSPHFSNSKRYPALLSYIVVRTLEGRADSLKERTLGIEVFQRAADYDTSADTVVRYTAGEVRKRLSLYYNQQDTSRGVQISLPVGSYVPEFLKEPEPELILAEPSASLVAESSFSMAEVLVPTQLNNDPVPSLRVSSQMLWFATILLLFGSLSAVAVWKLGPGAPTAVDRFWQPALQAPGSALLCVGGNVFSENNFSGTMTAGKDIPYPFVSMQLASAIAHVGGLLEGLKTSYHLQASAPTPLDDLRERPVILLGGYNNLWTMRLVSSLRFQFTPEPSESIVDRDRPGRRWIRDKTLPYASADDYAIIARFRDARTGSVIVLLAGLGRNGTEAAAQFVTSPTYMQQLSKRLDKTFDTANIEAIIKVSVIDGKTGAPSIEDTYAW